jgi:hypothetical protein
VTLLDKYKVFEIGKMKTEGEERHHIGYSDDCVLLLRKGPMALPFYIGVYALWVCVGVIRMGRPVSVS